MLKNKQIRGKGGRNTKKGHYANTLLSPVVFASQMKMITFFERLGVNYEKINYY
jgi:hypothetical protein